MYNTLDMTCASLVTNIAAINSSQGILILDKGATFDFDATM